MPVWSGIAVQGALKDAAVADNWGTYFMLCHGGSK